MRARLRDALWTVGLLPAALEVRNRLRAAGSLRRNARYFLDRTPGALPLPPAHLVLLVTGTPDLGWFLESGQRAAGSIRAALEKNGLDLERSRAILDFGCGCGRVIRHWKDLPAQVHGTDYNRRLVAWCRRRLGFARFETNALAPPLPYGAGAFDLVYALSVFTHLPDALQHPWMEEMRRVLSPGGHLLITTHGERYAGELSPQEQVRFRAGELVVRHQELPGSNVCGAYHPRPYVKDRLAKGFAEVDWIPEGALGNPHQDLYLLRRT